MIRKDMMVIKNSSDPKKVGKAYPQTEYLFSEETDDLDFLSKQKGIRINRKLNLNNILLRSSAKLTDAISCSLGAGNDMIISSRFYEILKKGNCGPVQFFKVSFQYKKEIINDFFWMHFVYELEPLIDFKQTTYNYKIFPELKRKPLKDFKEYKKFYNEKDEYGLLRSTKTVLLKEFNQELDMFVLSQIDQNIYVSKKLYSELNNLNISGLDYEVAHLWFATNNS